MTITRKPPTLQNNLEIASRMTVPPNDTNRAGTLKFPSLIVLMLNNGLRKYPPTNAPTIPTITSEITPCRLLVFMMTLANQPMNPPNDDPYNKINFSTVHFKNWDADERRKRRFFLFVSGNQRFSASKKGFVR
jgi:hypothetical protein